MRLTILALTAAAATASAATVFNSNTATDYANNTNFTSLALSQFDPSQGTLTGVSITINELSYGGSFNALAIDADVTVNSASGTLTLRGSPLSSLGFNQISVSDPLTLTPSGPFTIDASENQTFNISVLNAVSPSSYTIDSSFFSAYIGTGSITFEVRNSNPSVNATTIGDVSYDRALASGFADMTVTYTYTPVPEPSTYGMILGGLALAGAALRRRQKAAK